MRLRGAWYRHAGFDHLPLSPCRRVRVSRALRHEMRISPMKGPAKYTLLAGVLMLFGCKQATMATAPARIVEDDPALPGVVRRSPGLEAKRRPALVAAGRGSAGRAESESSSSVRSPTRPATGATSWRPSRSRTRRSLAI